MSADREDEIIAAYAAGEQIDQIATRFGIPTEDVNRDRVGLGARHDGGEPDTVAVIHSLASKRTRCVRYASWPASSGEPRPADQPAGARPVSPSDNRDGSGGFSVAGSDPVARR